VTKKDEEKRGGEPKMENTAKDSRNKIISVIVSVIVAAVFLAVGYFGGEKGKAAIDKYAPIIITATSVIDKLIADDTQNDTLSITNAVVRAASLQFQVEYDRPPDNAELERIKDIVKQLLTLKGVSGEFGAGSGPPN
jgi:hypothetical protein